MPKNPKKIKIPKRQGDPGQSKNSPRGDKLAESIPQMLFRWRIGEYLDWDGMWSFSNVELENLLREIIPKLHNYETMTWSQVEGAKSHFVSVDKLCNDARRRLEDISLQRDMLFSLRMTGKNRVWGIREGYTFHVLWWDPNHTVYPSHKKGT